MKAEGKLKIVEKHLTEKRKLATDVQSRMEKHTKNIDDIKARWVGKSRARVCAMSVLCLCYVCVMSVLCLCHVCIMS